MTKISVNFHALPFEIIEFIKESVRIYNLYIVLVELFPTFSAQLLNERDISNLLQFNITNRIYLYIDKPEITFSNQKDFLEYNPEFITITNGKYVDNTLEESWMAGNTRNNERIWRKFIKGFKSMTHSGAWVINPKNGEEVFCDNHRFTEEAKNLFNNGIQIVPITGWNYYRFRD
jgi:hypothetical protein